MNSTLPNVHAENEQRKQQRRAKKHIERRISMQHPAQCAKHIICNAKCKAGQGRYRKLCELKRNFKVHLSEKLLPEAARGGFVLVAELAYAALDAQLPDIEAYLAYVQAAAAHN